MPSPKLVELTTEHNDSLTKFMQGFSAANENTPGFFPRDGEPITQTVERLRKDELGEDLPEGFVPATTRFWQEGHDLQGVINLRHRLTPALRRFGGHMGYSVSPNHRRRGIASRMIAAMIPTARELGLERLLLTCDATNIGSHRAMEKNGAIMEREEWYEPTQRVQRWYWIELQG